jgi:DNA-binding NarL/FixJ family response regulator
MENLNRHYRNKLARLYPDTYKLAALLSQGYTVKDVAAKMHFSVGTVAAVQANLNRNSKFSALVYACNYTWRPRS